jgi:hypothetical protein
LLKRITIFQLILNFIEEAMLTVPPSAKIDKIKDNYAGMQKQSQKVAYDVLQGVTRLSAGSERGAPRSHQRDSFKQRRPSSGNNVPQQRDTSFKQQPQPSTSMKDVVCNKCQHKGHVAKNCTSAYTKSGKFLGVGPPPPNHHWTKKHAEDAKAKKAAMVKTPPQQQHHQQQQQQ